MQAAQRQQEVFESIEEEKGRNAKEKIDKTLTEEIVIAICAPIGTLKDQVIGAIINRLSDYNYEHEIVKLSSFIKEHNAEPFTQISGKTESFSLLQHRISGGNTLRSTYTNSVLAEFAISKIY